MMNELLNKGIGKRWQKNGMDRIYINLSTIADIEYDGVRTANYFNRQERNNVKIFWDVNKNELVVTDGDSEAKKAVEASIRSLIA